jgi:SAM-dependent methyltransferase
MNQHNYKCHICHSDNIFLIEEFSLFTQVTSDCRPWKRGGKLGICQSCGCVQKIIDEAFIKDSEEIYRTYSVYYQADGKEQKVFEQSKGVSQSRSESIIIELLKQVIIPAKGSLLDIGCGNGNLLRSFSKLCPAWILSGSEFDEQNRDLIEKLDHVESFYSCEVMDINAKFDMISMIHCLEHIVDPVTFLQTVKEKLNTNGLLLIEIPTYTANPFDLIIADHCTHFEMGKIKTLLSFCGFEVVLASTDIVPKEITILARKDVVSETTLSVTEKSVEDVHRRLLKSISWLKENIACASRIADHDELGIFGTSIAGVWVYNEISEKVSFFVDEDTNRINKLFLNRKVYHPKNLPDKGIVFIPLSHGIATRISDRLKIYGNRFVVPPPL